MLLSILLTIFTGTLRIGTTLCVPNLDLIIGKVTRIENNHKEVQFAKKSTQVHKLFFLLLFFLLFVIFIAAVTVAWSVGQ